MSGVNTSIVNGGQEGLVTTRFTESVFIFFLYLVSAFPLLAIVFRSNIYYLSLGAIMVIITYTVIKDKKLVFSPGFLSPIILYSVFLFYCGISVLWGGVNSLFLAKFIPLSTICVMLLISPQLFVSEPENLHKLLSLLLFASTIIGIIIIISYLLGNTIRPYELIRADTHISVGRILGIATPIASYYALEGRSWLTKTASIISASILLISLLLLGSRGPTLAAVISTAIIVAKYTFSNDKYKMPVVGVGLLFVFSAPLVLSRFSSIIFRLPTISEFAPILSGNIDDSAGSRIEFYIQALDMWTRSPFLGSGLSGFHTQVGTYPHNILFEIISELGLIGLFMFSLFILLSIKPLFGRLDLSLSILMISLFVFCIINASVSSNLPGQRALFFVLGLCISPVFTQTNYHVNKGGID